MLDGKDASTLRPTGRGCQSEPIKWWAMGVRTGGISGMPTRALECWMMITARGVVSRGSSTGARRRSAFIRPILCCLLQSRRTTPTVAVFCYSARHAQPGH